MRRGLLLVLVSILLATACGDDADPVLVPAPVELDDGVPGFEGRADIRSTGNRISTGAGDLDGPAIEVMLDSPAVWVVPTSDEAGAPWVVVFDDGRLATVDVFDGTVTVLDVEWGGAEPIVRESGDIEAVWAPNAERPDLLADGRAVTDGDITVVLADPTDRYGHAVLGDDIEAATVEIQRAGDGSVLARVELDGDVVEGRTALLGDVDGDGVDEILVTQSNSSGGARLVVYDRDGELVAESAPIGRGNRWRNQLAIAPLGPNGEIEVVDVRTPHLGRTIEWFRLDGDELVLVAEEVGYTSHVLGSRNLDLAIVADADGDGRLEVVAPMPSRTKLGVIARVDDGTEVEFTVDLGARLSSNFGAVDHPDGGATYVAGTDDGVLRFWVS